MANIDQDLQAIMQARYGRDVRQSIHDAIYDMNVESTHAESAAVSAQDSAQNSATLAESYSKGGTGTRTGEDTDNAEYYKEEAERLAGVYAVEDNLTSTSTIHSLSANQGRVLNGKVTNIEDSVGSANGIATLDGTGRVPYSQLPESAMEFKGTWNANTNTPTLTAGVGDTGDFYVVSVGGTWHGMTFNPNDRIVFDGVTAHDWIKLVAGEVNSVNGMSGQVQLNSDDIPFDNTGSGIVADDVEGAIKELANTPNGHVVKDQGGTSLTQRPTMQFLDVTPSDDSTNERTILEIFKPISKTDLDNLGANTDGLYITNEADEVVDASAVGFDNTDSGLVADNVQGAIDEIGGKVYTVVADGTKTEQQILAQLYSLMNSDGLTFTLWSRLKRGNYIHRAVSNTGIFCGLISVGPNGIRTREIYIASTGSFFHQADIGSSYSYTDMTNTVSPSGTEYTLYV